MLRKRGFVTITEFSRLIGVSQPAVTQAIQAGRVRVYDGDGRRVGAGYSGRKWLKPAEARQEFEQNRIRFDNWFLER